MSAQKKQDMNKKISEISIEERRSFMKPLGIPGLPYPMAKLEKNDKGLSDHTVGAVHSAQNPFVVYSPDTVERVNGQMFRSMPTPSMMFMLRDLLSRMAPESDNCLMTIFGDASAGKTFMFYQVGDLVHPQGALKVDCGGMNMHELFFRTVIDYGQGIKDQLENHAAAGRLGKSSIEMLNGAFPGSVVEKGGDILIDWELIGKPDLEKEESWQDASSRARSILELVYAKQGISVQTNSFGIKTVPGEVFEAWESGRPLVLDEFNKSKRGTLDTFQTFLQFLNGEKGFETFTAHNPLAESSDSGDCPKSITLNRKDRKLGWFVGIAGNDSSDGDTTQELSVSMLTRLNPLRIGAPALRDWQHRLSQIYTGLPLTTLYNLFGETAKSNPTEFGQWLVQLRKLGLNEDEVKAIPPHEIHYLTNFQDTIPAIEKLSDYYNTRLQLSNPESDMYRSNKHADVSDEVSAHGDRVHVSFRKAIADFNKALLATPEVIDNKGLKLNFNLAALFSEFDASAIASVKPGWHTLGANLARVIQEDIANDTIDMDKTHEALIKACEDKGVLKAKLSGAKASKEFKTIADLLKYEEIEYLGGSEALIGVRNVLIAAVKNKYKQIKGQDEDVIPLASLNRAMISIKEAYEEKGAELGDRFVMPNDDVSEVTQSPVLHGFTNTVYFPDEPQQAEAVEKANAAPSPAAAPASQKTEEEIENEEVMNILMGKSSVGLDLAFIEVADSKGKPAYLTILEDKRDIIAEDADRLMLVIGHEDIAPALQAELSKTHISYITYKDTNFRDRVNEYMGEAAKFRAIKKKFVFEDAEKVTVRLVFALSSICDLEGGANDNRAKPAAAFENAANASLVDYRMALAGFAVPEYGALNRNNIWPVKLAEMSSYDDEPAMDDDGPVEMAEGSSFVDALEKVNKARRPSCYTSILKHKR